MLPFTPIVEELLDPEWVRSEYPVLATSLTRASPLISSGWRSMVYQAHAIIDAEAAWSEVRTLQRFDDGKPPPRNYFNMTYVPTRMLSSINIYTRLHLLVLLFFALFFFFV